MLLKKKLLYELGEEYINKKGNLWLKVISSSMEPMFRIGDMIFVETVKDGKIFIGDIIVFKRKMSEGEFVTHRVIGKRRINGELCFLEKGDRIDIANWIHEDAILGKVNTVKRNGKIIVRLNNDKWFVLISKLFAFYQLSGYVFGKKISSLKNRSKEYKAIRCLKKPCRYCYNSMKKTRKLVRKLTNPIFIKVMNLSV